MMAASPSAASNSTNQLDGTGKRRVSFGQIELSQLEIPTVYKHSNVGLEKHKLNPNFYLADGSLKRKFSLPKLTDSIESVRDCRYLRRSSLESDEVVSHADVVNIFKDLNPTPNEIRNFDFVHEDDAQHVYFSSNRNFNNSGGQQHQAKSGANYFSSKINNFIYD
jgi:hypothetical protein